MDNDNLCEPLTKVTQHLLQLIFSQTSSKALLKPLIYIGESSPAWQDSDITRME